MSADRAPADVLARAAVDGDDSAWQALVDRYVPLVWSVCRRCHLSEAGTAAVSQLVFTQALTLLPTLTRPGALPAWLATTTRQECLCVLLARRPAPDVVAPVGALPDDERLDLEPRARVRASFARLPMHRRRLVGLAAPAA